MLCPPKLPTSGGIRLSELPPYLSAPLPDNWAAEITSDLRVRLRRFLIRELWRIEDTTSTSRMVRLSDDIGSFAGGHKVQAEGDKDILQKRHLRYENAAGKLRPGPDGRRVLVTTKLIEEFIFGNKSEGGPVDTNKGTVGVIRDFLAWRKGGLPDDLLDPVTDLDDAYRMWSVVQPRARSGQAADRFSGQGANYAAKLDDAEIGTVALLNLKRLRPGLFKIDFRQQNPQPGSSTLSLASFFLPNSGVRRLDGWLLHARNISLGHLHGPGQDGVSERTPIRLTDFRGDNSFCAHIGGEIVEVASGSALDDTEESTAAFNFLDKKHEVMYNELPHREIYGGDKFVNNGVGDEVNDYTDQKYGVELSETLEKLTNIRLQLGWAAADRAERDQLHARCEELIEGGAPLDVPNSRGWYPLSVAVACRFWKTVGLMCRRDDVDYLVKSPKGLYPFEVGSPDTLTRETFPLTVELLERAVEQGKARGITRNEILGHAGGEPSYWDNRPEGPN